MPTEFSFYDILGLERNASQEDIKNAYRSAVKKYHPDVNSAPNAQRLTVMLNEAYSVLSDPAQRSEYDQTIDSGGHTQSQQGESQSEIWDLFTCDSCGRVDPHLRFSTFFRVWSIVFWTQMRGVGGVLCPSCRSKFAATSAIFSGFLGFWSFPWGIIYTIRSLAASIRGGEMKRLENAQLLRHLGVAFAQRGLFHESKTAFNASLSFEKNPAVFETLKRPEFMSALILKSPGWLRGQSIALASLTYPLLVLFVIGILGYFSDQSASDSNAKSQTLPPVSANGKAMPDTESTWPPCLDENSKIKGNELYKQCSETRAELEKTLTNSTSDSKIEKYKILGAIAEFNQASGAFESGRTDAKQLAMESISVFTAMKDSAKEPHVRKIAQNYYNCYVLEHCQK